MFSKSKNQPLTLPMSIGKLGKGLDMSRHLHLNFHVTRNPQDLIVLKSPLWLLHISLKISNKNAVLDQEKNVCLISLSILNTCLLSYVWISQGDITSQ